MMTVGLASLLSITTEEQPGTITRRSSSLVLDGKSWHTSTGCVLVQLNMPVDRYQADSAI